VSSNILEINRELDAAKLFCLQNVNMIMILYEFSTVFLQLTN